MVTVTAGRRHLFLSPRIGRIEPRTLEKHAYGVKYAPQTAPAGLTLLQRVVGEALDGFNMSTALGARIFIGGQVVRLFACSNLTLSMAGTGGNPDSQRAMSKVIYVGLRP